MSLGAVLAERRGERGLSIEQVASATRVRSEYLRALEADQSERLPAPVYTIGYLRTYARYLGLDPEPMVELLRSRVEHPTRSQWNGFGTGFGNGFGTGLVGPRIVFTAPAVAAVGLLLLAGAFALYAWQQVEADQRPGITVATAPPPAAVAPASPVPSPSPEPRPIVVGVRVTDAVWLNVVVDGKSQYSDSGKILPAGSQVYFTGVDIKITSGKAAATMITIDGRPMGALGTGVATREFSSQTSP